MMDKFIQNLARKSGKILSGFFGKAQIVKTKTHPADVVTEADLAVEKFIVSAIRKNFPNHGIVAEESGNHFNGRDYVWYIDPLDGTYNFSRGIKSFCVMIALAHKGRLKHAVIFDPLYDITYHATVGKGAYANKRKIHCSKQQTWPYCYGAFGGNLQSPDKLAFLQRLLYKAAEKPFWMIGTGSAGITASYVAQGSLDWWASLEGGSWDYAAPALILQEAGCVITDKVGNQWKSGDTSMIAANKYLHPQLLKLVRGK